MALLNERPAKGTKGCLLRMVGHRKENSPLVFRVYKTTSAYRVEQMRKKERGEPYDESAWEFRDYDITHYDVDMIIDDKSAAFYDRENGEGVLDYTSSSMKPVSRATLKKVISGKRGKKK